MSSFPTFSLIDRAGILRSRQALRPEAVLVASYVRVFLRQFRSGEASELGVGGTRCGWHGARAPRPGKPQMAAAASCDSQASWPARGLSLSRDSGEQSRGDICFAAFGHTGAVRRAAWPGCPRAKRPSLFRVTVMERHGQCGQTPAQQAGGPTPDLRRRHWERPSPTLRPEITTSRQHLPRLYRLGLSWLPGHWWHAS